MDRPFRVETDTTTHVLGMVSPDVWEASPRVSRLEGSLAKRHALLRALLRAVLSYQVVGRDSCASACSKLGCARAPGLAQAARCFKVFRVPSGDVAFGTCGWK